ncbi:MAG: nucleoside deaminase [Hyphomicrobiaceae bacterium]
MQEKFMRRALEIARESLDEPDALPYGAVIVRDGEIVGEGLNKAIALHDPTSHGEVEAIRDACRRLGTTDLVGCDIYTTAEPCSMCVATMHVTGIARLFYASASAQSTMFAERLTTVNGKWKRRVSGDGLRHEVGLPLDQRPCRPRKYWPRKRTNCSRNMPSAKVREIRVPDQIC